MRCHACSVLPVACLPQKSDPAPGTARFQVSEEDGLALMAALRGRLPGHALPFFVRETPMGGGKKPVE